MNLPHLKASGLTRRLSVPPFRGHWLPAAQPNVDVAAVYSVSSGTDYPMLSSDSGSGEPECGLSRPRTPTAAAHSLLAHDRFRVSTAAQAQTTASPAVQTCVPRRTWTKNTVPMPRPQLCHFTAHCTGAPATQDTSPILLFSGSWMDTQDARHTADTTPPHVPSRASASAHALRKASPALQTGNRRSRGTRVEHHEH